MSDRLKTAVVALAAVVPTLAAATPALAHGRHSPREDRRSVRQLICARQFDRAIAAYLDTSARHDAPGFEALMDHGDTIILPGGTTFAGKPSAAGFIDRFFARTDWTQTFQETSKSVDGCHTATVVFASTYSDEDGPQPLVIGLSWTYARGTWRTVLDQNTVVDPS